MFRECPACAEDKPIEAFGVNRTLPDGLSFYRQDCACAKARERYRRRRAAAGFTVREKDDSPEGYKRCTDCRQVLPIDFFHRHNTFSDGRNICCKSCRKRRGADTHIKRMYGLTRVELDALVEARSGLCAICQSNPAVHVDHDHATGKIRGVLCFTCNVALGHLRDDVVLFRKAIDYLER